MWSFYNKYVRNNHYCCKGLTVLAKYETRKYKMTHILNIIDKYFDLNEDLSINQLILFYRIAVKCKNHRFRQHIWNILEQKDQENKIKKNVFAKFSLNGETHAIEYGYNEECEFNSDIIVDKIMNEIDYKINTLYCHELPSKNAKEKHLKYNSEKKVLAVLINEKEKQLSNDKNIRIKVSMKMCMDCHQFFCQISNKYVDYIIECVDPSGNHVFKNGNGVTL